ncbi:hypothetical protein FVEG_17540 [Fusarium verticillioides 7600]|uniref:Heterokaryon incompatibility domain-containing protein n=1 Tax=Gibberella moniliformis (strain M3125 / FGSC 7600) TaxID=334819 RepID=W7N749_GIBM7|nr:hypothetical protein FVEG_17540 [Fusarium verticillioides 7600]EWG55534.1 hypothetical protein FVEG_17540 [Fusarium verticillioides 7600]
MRPSPLERSRLCDACTHACSMSIVGCTQYTCQTHRSQFLKNNPNPYISTWDAMNDTSRWAKWSKTKRDFLSETTSSGCHLCIIIAHAFDEKSKEVFQNLGSDEVVRLCLKYRTVERDPSGKLGWDERTNMAITDIALGIDAPDEFWLAIRSDKGSALEEMSFDLRMRPLDETETSHVIKTIPGKHASTMNEQNLQLARKWIKGCNRSHPICKEFQSRQPNWRPTRLIHIGSKTQQPRLVAPSKPVSYLALSYCWGTDNTVTLTEATLNPFQNELPLSSLPSTIRDAITTTRDLGYEYLWVDALCIIQDCKPDWIKESAQMGSIYGSAALTLAAAGTSTVQDSIFCRRDPRAVRPCVANIIQSSVYHRVSYPWAIYPHQPERLLFDTINESPLSRRAWALQELLVSPRTLVFGSKQMVWSCATTEASETFPIGLDPKFSSVVSESASLSYLRQKLMRASKLEEEPSEFWNNFISRYTKARLTFSSDMLVALQGIVERITEARRGSNKCTPELEYVAGLWRDSNFQQSLLWRPKDGSSPTRPDYYRAPSWSWASLDGEVDFFEQYIPWIWNGKKTELARIVDICVEPQTGYSLSTTGQIKSGLIEMECHLRECYLMKKPRSEDSSHDQGDDAYLVISSDEYKRMSSRSSTEGAAGGGNQEAHKFANSCTIDLPEEIPSARWVQVYCVPLQLGWCQTDRYEQAVWESYEGLILMPHDAEEEDLLTSEGFCVLSQTFRRVGTFTFDLHDENREARENELLGPVVFDREGNWGGKRETVCII